MGEGKQKWTRAKYEGILSINTEKTAIEAAQCRNISLNGVFAETTERLPVGTRCHIELQLVGTNPDLVLSMNGHVVRHAPDGMGLTFEEFHGNTLEHLKKLVMYNAKDPEAFLQQFRKNSDHIL